MEEHIFFTLIVYNSKKSTGKHPLLCGFPRIRRSYMRVFRKLAAAVLAAAMAISAIPMTALAATSISSIKLDIDSNISSGDSDSNVDVTVHSDSAHYEVSDVEVTNEPSSEWKDSSRPKLQVTLTADDDYKFGSISKSDVDLYGSDGTVSSVKKSDGDLIVNITLDRLEDSDSDDDDDYDLYVTDPAWDESNGRAVWEGSDDAKHYELRLYRGGAQIASVTTSNDYYNFGSYFTSAGNYQYQIRAVHGSSNKSSWESSEYFYADTATANYILTNFGNASNASSSGSSSGGPSGTGSSSGTQTAVGTVTSASNGMWILDNNGWWFMRTDRTWPAGTWELIDGKWYLFNASGYMLTGWQQLGGNWYYLGTDGAMRTSTMVDGQYYVNANGVWVQ